MPICFRLQSELLRLAILKAEEAHAGAKLAAEKAAFFARDASAVLVELKKIYSEKKSQVSFRHLLKNNPASELAHCRT